MLALQRELVVINSWIQIRAFADIIAVTGTFIDEFEIIIIG